MGVDSKEIELGESGQHFEVLFNQYWTLLHNILHSFPQWISKFDEQYLARDEEHKGL